MVSLILYWILQRNYFIFHLCLTFCLLCLIKRNFSVQSFFGLVWNQIWFINVFLPHFVRGQISSWSAPNLVLIVIIFSKYLYLLRNISVSINIWFLNSPICFFFILFYSFSVLNCFWHNRLLANCHTWFRSWAESKQFLAIAEQESLAFKKKIAKKGHSFSLFLCCDEKLK